MMSKKELLKNPKIRTYLHLETLICTFIEDFMQKKSMDYFCAKGDERMHLIHGYVDRRVKIAVEEVLSYNENEINDDE